MGLLAWNNGPELATPWAESIRQFIVGEQMPPWYVDSLGPAVKGGFGLSPVQSDKLLTWATGGTPEGDPEKKPTPSTYHARWTGGPPDLLLPMAMDYTMTAEENEATRESVIPTGLREQRWLKAVDLMPGAAEIVRNASISVETPGCWQSGCRVTIWSRLRPAPRSAFLQVRSFVWRFIIRSSGRTKER